MHSTFFRSVRPFSLCLAAALALTACGGGGDSAPAVVGSQTGVFVDSAVSGLSYETSSGVKGTTDALGQFKYNPGDNVTFKIGGVTLGTGKATGTVTPAHISEGGEDSNKFTNLLVLLQSLDTDGDPANGITLPASLDGSKIAKVAERLNDDPADFTDDSKNAELKQSSPRGEIRKRDEARKHYEDTQAKTSTFLDDAAGVWTGWDNNDAEVTLRLTASGRYMLQVYSEGAERGIELGTFTRDATTGRISTSDIQSDTNGTAGWSHLSANRAVTVALSDDESPSGDTLVVTLTVTGQEPLVVYLERVRHRSNDIGGAWSTSPDLRLDAPLVLLAVGKGSQYVYIAPKATTATCAAGAYEAGSFSLGTRIDEDTEDFYRTLSYNSVYAETAGCGFLTPYAESPPLVYELSEDSKELTLRNPDGVPLKLYRIKRDKDLFDENNQAEES